MSSYEAREAGSTIKQKSRRGSKYQIRYWIETDTALATYLPINIGDKAEWVNDGTSTLTGGGFVNAYVTDFKILAVGPGNTAPYILMIEASNAEIAGSGSNRETDKVYVNIRNGQIFFDFKFFGMKQASKKEGGILPNADGSDKKRRDTKAHFAVDFTKSAGTPSVRANAGEYIFRNGDTTNKGSANYDLSPFNQNLDVRRCFTVAQTVVLKLAFYVRGRKENNYALWAGVNGSIPSKFSKYFYTTTALRWRAVDQHVTAYYNQDGNRYTRVERRIECSPTGLTWKSTRNGTWTWNT